MHSVAQNSYLYDLQWALLAAVKTSKTSGTYAGEGGAEKPPVLVLKLLTRPNTASTEAYRPFAGAHLLQQGWQPEAVESNS